MFIYAFLLCLCMRLFVCLFVCLFVRSFVCLFICSFVRSFILFVCSFISFVGLFFIYHFSICSFVWQRNPFAPVVPCHRVVMGDLSIGGFRSDRILGWTLNTFCDTAPYPGHNETLHITGHRRQQQHSYPHDVLLIVRGDASRRRRHSSWEGRPNESLVRAEGGRA